jgi:hypothetical protein
MSEENVEIVRRCFDDYRRGAPDVAPAWLAPSIQPSPTPPERGHAGPVLAGDESAGRLTGVDPGGVVTLICAISMSSLSRARPKISSRTAPVSASELDWNLKTTLVSTFISSLRLIDSCHSRQSGLPRLSLPVPPAVDDRQIGSNTGSGRRARMNKPSGGDLAHISRFRFSVRKPGFESR